MKAWFTLFALLSLAAAVYHAIGLFYPVNDAPLWRHALFVVVNGFCVYGFWRRPRYFVLVFAVLAVQQGISHGGSMLAHLSSGSHFTWIDPLVLLFVTTALILLIVDRQKAKS